MTYPDCPGESTKKGYEGWIPVHGINFEARASVAPNATGTARNTGKGEFGDIHLELMMDKSFNVMLSNCRNAKVANDVTIKCVETVNNRNIETYVVELKKVRVTNVNPLFRDNLREGSYSSSLNYARAQFTFMDTDQETGDATGTIPCTVDRIADTD